MTGLKDEQEEDGDKTNGAVPDVSCAGAGPQDIYNLRLGPAT